MTAYRGVRIVDFSQGVAGPMAAMLLGDFGAEIVKVEPPDGDRAKDQPVYHAVNRNKQVLTLDLAGAGREAAEALMAGADVAIFDHSPARLEALGLRAETLCARYPHLVHAWMPPYGVAGRWSELPARHALLSAATGVAFRQGCYGDTPVHLVLPLLWYGQAVTGAAAIGAALFERGRSGRGQGVVVSGLHGASEVGGPVRVSAAAPLPRAQPLGATPSYRLYRAADGEWFFLGTLFANFYHRAFEALGLADRWNELAVDLMAARLTLTELFLSEPRDHWVALLQAAGVPCAPVRSRESWFAGEAVAAGGLRRTLEHPVLGPIAVPEVAATFSDTPGEIRSLAAPVDHAPRWSPRASTAGSGPRGRGPLVGVRVLDLGTVIAGAHAGGILADLGAEVIKIEPVEGDPFRSDGGGFMAYNRGKRGLGLDLKQPAARELFYDLARSADVVFDNYRRGVRARLEIDYATLASINPRIISASINAYGDKGPRADRPGFDPLLQAEGGMMAAQGGADEPILHTIPVNDVATAAMVAASIVAALNARERTGRGQEILTSLMAQSLTFQFGEVVDYAGRPANAVGGMDCLGLSALQRFYEAADGGIAIACENEEEGRAVATALGLDLPSHPLTASRDGPLADAIAAAVRQRPRAEILDRLLAAGAPAAPCLRAHEAFDDPWLHDNRFFERWEHPRLGEIVSTCAYADFAGSPTPFRRATPDLAEHSVEVLTDLGVAPERIEALLAAGAVFAPGTRDGAAKSARVGDGGVALATQ